MQRFASLDEKETQQIRDEREAANTQKSNQVSFGVVLSYCTEKNNNFDITSISKCDLDSILKLFWVEARTQDGDMYKKSSICTLRHGIKRHIKKIRPDINIIDDSDFDQSNDMFKAQLVQLKKAGLAKVDHKQHVSKSDLSLLYSSGVFCTEKPSSLQKKVFFETMLYLCRRGRENLRSLSIDSFEVKQFPDGVNYVILVKDELTKNNRVNDEYNEGGMIVETFEENCPFASFVFYVSKLNPKCQSFFQRPKQIPSASPNEPWYDNQVVGVKTLDKMMKAISKEAGLSQLYTNHCIRATCITLLDSEGVEARHIMSISGHRSESSLRSYSKTNSVMKRKMASTISSVATCTTASKTKKTSDLVDLLPLVKKIDFGVQIPFEHEEEKESEQPRAIMARRDEKPSLLSSLFHHHTGQIQFSNCTFNI